MTDQIQFTQEQLSELARANVAFQVAALAFIVKLHLRSGGSHAAAVMALRETVELMDDKVAAMPFAELVDYMTGQSGPKLSVIFGGLYPGQPED